MEDKVCRVYKKHVDIPNKSEDKDFCKYTVEIEDEHGGFFVICVIELTRGKIMRQRDMFRVENIKEN